MTPADPFSVTLTFSPRDFDTLDLLGHVTGNRNAQGIVSRIVHGLVLDGVRRPGANERGWLAGCIGYDFTKLLEVYDPVGWQRFKPVCRACRRPAGHPPGSHVPRQLGGAGYRFILNTGECEDCFNTRLAAEWREDHGDRPRPPLVWHRNGLKIRYASPKEPTFAQLLSTEGIERRANQVTTEERRPRRRRHGCFGCTLGWEFCCSVCERWRCYCRSANHRPKRLTRSMCDRCADVYRDRWEPAAGALLGALARRRDDLLAAGNLAAGVPAGTDAQLGSRTVAGVRLAPVGARRTFIEQHLGACLARFIGTRRDKNITPRIRRRMLELGARTLRREGLRAQLAVVLAGWPVWPRCAFAEESTRDYLGDLYWAAAITYNTADDIALEDFVEEAQGLLSSWASSLADVFTDRAFAAHLLRVPELRWLSTPPPAPPPPPPDIEAEAARLFEAHVSLHPCTDGDRVAPATGPCPGCGQIWVRWRDLNPASLTVRRFRHLARTTIGGAPCS